MVNRPTQLTYSDVLFHVWYILAAGCGVAAVWTMVVGEWGWTLGWVVGSLALSAHARLERFDGHKHQGGVEVP